MKKLTFYICIFALVSFAVGSKKIGSEVEEHYNACLTENNISDDDIFTVQDILHDRHKQSENQEKKKKNGCLMQCILQKAEVMEGSEYDADKMRSLCAKIQNVEPGSKIIEILDNCINQTKDDTEKCDKSFALTECFYKGQDKISPLPENHEGHEHESEK